MRALAAAAALALLSSACRRGEGVSRRRAPKEAAPAPAAGVGALAAPPSGLRWSLPPGWSEKPGEGMRAATLLPPPAAGRAEVSVTAFPGDAGGEAANVNRWRGQLGLPPLGAAELAAGRGSLPSPAGALSLHDMTGAGPEPARTLAAVLTADGRTWFFKLSGTPASVAAARPGFLALLGGLRRDGR